MEFKTHITTKGEELLYIGEPDLNLLEKLAEGAGDCWHSSKDQGYKNCFPEIKYQTYTAWWYTNEFDNVAQSISWRINPKMFVVRKKVWEHCGGFDDAFDTESMQALSFGYTLISIGATPLYVKNLFKSTIDNQVKISKKDIYLFFKKHFRKGHSEYLLFRRILKNPIELFHYLNAGNTTLNPIPPNIKPDLPVVSIQGTTVSYIIPTMMRQDFTLNLLDDLKNQTYLPSEVIIIDATPEEQRNESLYEFHGYPFEIKLRWQTSKGSCRARNEAIELCTSEYIIFGDDDIRLAPDFIENHLRLLKGKNADACNGLDIRAGGPHENQDDLTRRRSLEKIDKAGVSSGFNNANSCVKREWVNLLGGNDVNFDGGYGEDSDFGLSLAKAGAVVLYNPFSVSLHLKPPAGGYRWWGAQSKIKGKKRKTQPWELGIPVKNIRPVPSPTIMYYNIKHFNTSQLKEYKLKYFLYFITRGPLISLPIRLARIPLKLLQYNRSLFYAKRLLQRGIQLK